MSGLTFFGIAASEVLDSSAEVIDIQGCDITDFEKGVGQFNYEHMGESEVKDGKVAPGQNWVGRIVYAKKIYKKQDCDNELEEKCWDSVKAAFVFVIGRLYDSAGHPGSQALAAIMRDAHRNGEKNIVRMSIEGSTLQRSENIIKQCVAKNIALTVKPCNKTCDTWVLFDPNAPDGFDKNPEKFNTDVLKDVAREMSKALGLDNYEPLSKKEREQAKKAVKAMVVKKMAEQFDPMGLFNKLLPRYQANAAAFNVNAIDSTTLNFVAHVKSAPITINFSPSKLMDLVRDGRYKTSFENPNTYDRADRDERKIFENRVFGIPLNAAHRARPVYGALHLGYNDLERMYEGGAPMFGSAFLVLKPEIKNRTTFTHNDSFVVGPEQVLPASALDKVAIAYINDPEKSDFIEAQIYGGVNFASDVECLCVPDEERINQIAIIFGEKYNVSVIAFDGDDNKRFLFQPGQNEILKTLTAGGYDAAPGSLVGGSALQVEDAGLRKKKIKKLIKEAFEKSGQQKTPENIKAFVKANLPELGDEYIEYFDDAADDLDMSKKLVRKAEFLAVELKKAQIGSDTQPETVDFNGKKVSPGHATANGVLHYLLDETDDAFIAAPHGAKDLSPANLVKFPKKGNSFTLHSVPTFFQNEPVLSSKEHGVFPFNTSPEQHALIEGLKLKAGSAPNHYFPGINEKSSYWTTHPTLGNVYIKSHSEFNDPLFPEPHREVAYHNLANNFFGLGHHLPKLAVFSHPETGELHTVQQALKDTYHTGLYDHTFHDTLRENMANGNLEKLLFMDHVLGNNDRHEYNFMHSPRNRHLFLIDHGNAFNTPDMNELATQANVLDGSFLGLPSHPGMKDWVKAFNKRDLHKLLVFNKVPANKMQEVMARFENAQNHILHDGPGKVY